MTAAEILMQLESLGQPSIKKVLLKHDIKEPLYGVKIEELKKIQKVTKQDNELALQLYATGVYDAMYLAGLIAESEKMQKHDLQLWAAQAHSPALREYTVAWVAAESRYGMELATEWIDADGDNLVDIGWATLSSIVAITDDAALDIPLLKKLLVKIPGTIHTSPNRVKQAMNGFVISTAIYVPELTALARATAEQVGKVKVDMGDTACKVPDALDHIAKGLARNSTGKKKKSARC